MPFTLVVAASVKTMLSLDNWGMPFTSVVAASVKTMLLLDNGGLPFMSMVAAPCPVLSWIKSRHLVWLLLGRSHLVSVLQFTLPKNSVVKSTQDCFTLPCICRSVVMEVLVKVPAAFFLRGFLCNWLLSGELVYNALIIWIGKEVRLGEGGRRGAPIYLRWKFCLLASWLTWERNNLCIALEAKHERWGEKIAWYDCGWFLF